MYRLSELADQPTWRGEEGNGKKLGVKSNKVVVVFDVI